MKYLLLTLLTLLTSCALFRPGGPDLGALADELALYRADGEAIVLAAPPSPELMAKLVKLDEAVRKVEAALRAADSGEPLTDVVSYAKAALAIADQIAAELPHASNLRFAIALARVILNHVAAGQFQQAADEDAVHAEAALSASS